MENLKKMRAAERDAIGARLIAQQVALDAVMRKIPGELDAIAAVFDAKVYHYDYIGSLEECKTETCSMYCHTQEEADLLLPHKERLAAEGYTMSMQYNSGGEECHDYEQHMRTQVHFTREVTADELAVRVAMYKKRTLAQYKNNEYMSKYGVPLYVNKKDRHAEVTVLAGAEFIDVKALAATLAKDLGYTANIVSGSVIYLG